MDTCSEMSLCTGNLCTAFSDMLFYCAIYIILLNFRCPIIIWHWSCKHSLSTVLHWDPIWNHSRGLARSRTCLIKVFHSRTTSRGCSCVPLSDWIISIGVLLQKQGFICGTHLLFQEYFYIQRSSYHCCPWNPFTYHLHFNISVRYWLKYDSHL